jgi:hypothetical protein
MNKHLALAYGFAGLAAAAALIAFVTTSTPALAPDDLGSPATEAPPAAAALLAPEPPLAANVETAAEAPVEYVYVDEPLGGTVGSHGDHEEEDEEDDHHHRGDHDDDD